MLQSVLLIGILISSGYLIATRLLRVPHLMAALGLGCTLGLSLFSVLTNVLAYEAPVRYAALIAIIVCALITITLLFATSRSKFTESVPTYVWWIGGLAAFILAFATARFLTSDPWMWSYLPLTSLIREGVFPPVEPANPWSIAGYHYIPQLLAAVFSIFSGYSLAFGYNVQPFFGAFGAVFLAITFLRAMRVSWSGSLIGALLFMGASGLQWFSLMQFPVDLIAFFSGEEINIFRSISPSFASTFGPSMAIVFGSRTFTLGVAQFLAMLYCMYSALHESFTKKRVLWELLLLPLGASLALTMETAFVLIYPAGIAYLILSLLQKQSDTTGSWKRVLEIAFVGLLPTLLLSLIQGGVLTSALSGTQLSPGAFGLNNGTVPVYWPVGPYVGFWSWTFIRSTGLPFLLVPVVTVYVWKSLKTKPFLLVLWAIAILHILIPLVIRYEPRDNEMLRFLYVGFALIAMMFGVMMSETWLISKILWKKSIAIIAIASMLIASCVYLVLRASFPTLRFESAPLFAPMPPITEQQAAMYEYVRNNSGIYDYFYSGTLPDLEPGSSYTEEEWQQRHRTLFMMYTGRSNVGFLLWGNMLPSQIEAGKVIEKTCDQEAFGKLDARYLVIETAERAEWFKRFCKPKEWTLWYNGAAQTELYPRIYERNSFLGE